MTLGNVLSHKLKYNYTSENRNSLLGCIGVCVFCVKFSTNIIWIMNSKWRTRAGMTTDIWIHSMTYISGRWRAVATGKRADGRIVLDVRPSNDAMVCPLVWVRESKQIVLMICSWIKECYIEELIATILCRMLSWWTKDLAHSICDTFTYVVPLCSLYQAPSYRPNLTFLAPFPTEWAYLDMLLILEVVCTVQTTPRIDSMLK